tara:strand:+ start:426 stop:734 length:309 start_codon:yes stop_codon:yes gene_type:complete
MSILILLQSNPGNGIAGFLPIILLLLVFYFFMIRPQIKKQKEEDIFRSDIKKGQKIVTIGGIHGRVAGIQDSKIILEINQDNKITLDKHSISREKSLQYKQK